MGDLRPLGSEKLQGPDKLKRIMEIATYGQSNESNNDYKSADYSIQLADGNHYGIVKEKLGYIVKKGINESELDYIEPMKNRKYHKSFSQAMKKINLLAGELNRIHEHVENISLIGEQKRFVLKTPESEKPAPQPEPETDELDLDLDMGGEESATDELDLDLDMDMGGEELSTDELDLDLDMDMGGEEPSTDEGGVDGLKIIQKLTGKLGQKLRTMDQRQGLSSEDIKYVLNSIISAVDLAKLSEEDREDVLSKFESDDIIDYGVDDEAELDIDAGEDELDFDLDMSDEESDETETEIEEGDMYASFGDYRRKDFKGDVYYDETDRLAKSSDIYGIGGDDFDTEEFDTFQKLYDKYGDKQSWFNKTDGEEWFNINREKTGRPLKVKTRKSEMEEQGMDEMSKMVDEIFAESKVDKVLNRYFKENKVEKTINEEKKIKNFLNEKIKNVSIRKEMKKLSESIEQELASEFLIKENNNINFLGKTNLKNLLFESDGVKYKVTTKGEII
jgi:hypothetical protein